MFAAGEITIYQITRLLNNVNANDTYAVKQPTLKYLLQLRPFAPSYLTIGPSKICLGGGKTKFLGLAALQPLRGYVPDQL